MVGFRDRLKHIDIRKHIFGFVGPEINLTIETFSFPCIVHQLFDQAYVGLRQKVLNAKISDSAPSNSLPGRLHSSRRGAVIHTLLVSRNECDYVIYSCVVRRLLIILCACKATICGAKPR